LIPIDYSKDDNCDHYSKSKFERLIQYTINYPTKLQLILSKLERKFVSFYYKNEFSNLLLVLEVIKGLMKGFSNISLQHLLETHCLFMISSILKGSREIVLLKGITLVIKDAIKYQVFHNYDTFLGKNNILVGYQSKVTRSLGNGKDGSKGKGKKERNGVLSLPYYTHDENDDGESRDGGDHYDFIFIILSLCNNIVEIRKKRRFQRFVDEEKARKAGGNVNWLNPNQGQRNHGYDRINQTATSASEVEEKSDNDDIRKGERTGPDSTIREKEKSEELVIEMDSDYNENDNLDSLTCLGLSMIITILGMFRTHTSSSTSSSAAFSTSSTLNHLHNINNKYFHIIFQSVIKLLIFTSQPQENNQFLN
jgi:hypothetical protein